jgi:hypothetical protein
LVEEVQVFWSMEYAMETGQENGVQKSFRDWLSEGEHLYAGALGEYQAIEAQIENLEERLAAKKAEVNQIAHVIGKPPVEGNRRLTAQLVEGDSHNLNTAPAGNIARALSGRGLSAR